VITCPVLDLRLDDSLGEQLLGVVDLDAPLAHHLGERVVFLLGFLHPQHVVEEQLFRIRRRKTRMLQPGPVDQHLAEFPDLRMHSERHRRLLDSGQQTPPDEPTRGSHARPHPRRVKRALLALRHPPMHNDS
jgi:hypothetical protein